MSTTTTLLLILPSLPDAATDLGLPPTQNNIFHRLIRNLHAESDHPRERECTEMLAGVLMNAPTVRTHVLGWMATAMGIGLDILAGMEFDIQTEQSIGAKRDDLRIEGRTVDGDATTPALLWTIEVKVGAFFHDSSLQADEPHEPPHETQDQSEEGELVNQITNYDRWLAEQPHRHRGGFVLALSDLTSDLPEPLTCPWICLTWTSLGMAIKEALLDPLPPQEALPAKHLLGFLMTHLWRSSEMPDAQLSFDDVALLRAFEQIGDDCRKKVDRLVDSLVGLFAESGLGHGQVGRKKDIFSSPLIRSMVWRHLFADDCPDLMAGILGDAMVVWIQISPRHAHKAKIRSAVAGVLDALQKRHPAWEQGEDDWWDLSISTSMASLLVAENQQATLKDFVSKALADLTAARAIRQIGLAVGEKVE